MIAVIESGARAEVECNFRAETSVFLKILRLTIVATSCCTSLGK